MNRWVEISFRCVPLRSVARMTPPVDAPNEAVALFRKLRRPPRNMVSTTPTTSTTASVSSI